MRTERSFFPFEPQRFQCGFHPPMHQIKSLIFVANPYKKHSFSKTPHFAKLYFKGWNFPSSCPECSHDSIDRTFRRIP